jgi:hypothetical protein
MKPKLCPDRYCQHDGLERVTTYNSSFCLMMQSTGGGYCDDCKWVVGEEVKNVCNNG